MAQRTVFVETPVMGWSWGDVVVVDDQVPIYAALIAGGRLLDYSPPPAYLYVPNPSEVVRLGDLQDPGSSAWTALGGAFLPRDASGGLALTPASNGRGVLLTAPSWSADRPLGFVNKDGLFYIDRFTDASGKATVNGKQQSYTKLFGADQVTKTGPGNVDAFWASISHLGPDEVGLFIGDVTAKAGGAGGNLWGGHLYLAAEVAATMRGLIVELNPQVDVSTKTTFGVWGKNDSDTFGVNALLRTSGKADRHIICYADAAATTIIFDVDQAGNVRSAGTVTPIANGTIDLGGLGNRWRQLHANNVTLNAADAAGVSVGISMTNRAGAPTRANTNGGTLYVESGKLKYQGTGGAGTTPVTVALAGGVPTLTVQAGAGTGATAALTAPGNDQAGTVTVTLGTTPAAGSQVRVAFNALLATTPRAVQITAANAATASALPYVTGAGTSGFTVATVNVPGGGLVFSYQVAE